MKKSVKIQVYGRVQGVGFRYYTCKKAKELGVFGAVKNRPDGSVLIKVVGDEQRINEFLDWCKIGPDLARVDKVLIAEIPEIESNGFYIA